MSWTTSAVLLDVRKTRDQDHRLLQDPDAGKRAGALTESILGGGVTASPAVRETLELRDGRISARVIIEGYLVFATLDTGATRSFIGERLAHKIRQNSTLCEVKTILFLADGT